MKVIVLLVLILFNATNLFAQQTITFRVVEAPPRYYKDTNGNWTGIDVELGRTLLENAGLTPLFVDIPWKRALVELQEGRLQFITNFSYSKERSDYMHYIGPERYTGRNLIVRNDNKDIVIKSLDDFVPVCTNRSKTFGFQDGVQYSKEFHQELLANKNFKDCFESVTRPQQNIDKTLNGRIIGYFGHPLSTNYLIRTDPKYKNLVVHDFVLSREPVFFGVSKAGVDDDTLLRLYKSYEQLIENGTIQRIRQKWENF